MSISWGKVLGGVAAVTGVAVAGVGLGGDAIANALGSDTALGGFFDKAGDHIVDTAKSAAEAVGLKDVDGKTVAAVVGGAAALAGGAAMMFSGNKDEQARPVSSQNQQLQALIDMLPDEAKAQLLEGLKVAMSQAQGGPLPAGPGGKGRGGLA